MTLTQETLNLILLQIACCGTTVADVVIMAMSQTDTRDGHPGGVSLHIEDSSLKNYMITNLRMKKYLPGWIQQ
jgi:hypothetical protein